MVVYEKTEINHHGANEKSNMFWRALRLRWWRGRGEGCGAKLLCLAVFENYYVIEFSTCQNPRHHPSPPRRLRLAVYYGLLRRAARYLIFVNDVDNGVLTACNNTSGVYFSVPIRQRWFYLRRVLCVYAVAVSAVHIAFCSTPTIRRPPATVA